MLDTGPVQLPTRRRYAGHVPWTLDPAAVAAAAEIVQGRQDFAALASSGGSVKTTIRTITRSEAAFDGPTLVYEVEADGFLRKMVRSIVGGLIAAGRGAASLDDLRRALAARRPPRLARARRGPRTDPRARASIKIGVRAAPLMSLQDLLEVVPTGSEEQSLLRSIDFARLPRHVAVIMDGNGRWASLRHKRRVEGHRAGIASVRDVVETSARLGLQVLTLYAFSVENWKRPRSEVSVLMGLLKRYLRMELRHPPRQQHPLPGHRADGRPAARRAGRAAARDGEDGGLHRPAVQHRAQLRRPGRDHRRRAAAGGGRAAHGPRSRARIDEPLIASYMYTAGQPDPDLLIRTSGEMRISNFLLWQIAYAEIWVTDVLWPDFRRKHLLQAIVDFQKRERRYGGIASVPESR